MLVTRRSPLTGQTNTMDLPVTQAQLDEMALPPSERRYVQEIFPNLTPSQREFIKTGYTPEDWEEMFPPEDEDDGHQCMECGQPPNDCRCH